VALGKDPSTTALIKLMDTIMPGETAPTPVAPEDIAVLYLMFRDSAGINWVRSPDGALEEVGSSPMS
jgi:hypothetical protein